MTNPIPSLITPKNQRGLSLVELMIALVLGLLLSTGVISIFLTSKQSYQTQDAVSQIQENARFAQEFIARDARMAGFTGCSGEMVTANTVENASNIGDFNRAIEGIDGDSSAIPGRFTDALAGSDVLVLHITRANSEMAITEHKPNSARFDTTNPHGIEPGTIMMVVDSNCTSRGVFVMTGPASASPANMVHNTGKSFSYDDGSTSVQNCTKALKGSCDCGDSSMCDSNAYTDGSSLFSITTVAYYVQDPAQNTSLSSPTLYRLSFDGSFDTTSSSVRAEPLVEGVADLDVFYGVWEDNKMQYKTAGEVDADEWQEVRSIKLDVMTESLTDLDGSPLQRRFERTVKLRNR